ncbi:DNA translocase FtsK [Ammoniphilus sp. CFH 90114]|uniref:FtsK/SpoIIIE family DNA translocase n=1 Tax=Ammoniphilus sp. CFH 90114 TaxID=2493665 RepID=UPI00100FAA22|nr:DNA translocase FtsK [Ammoniphilus sp. CFH 90114]RXT15176.1 DNA translocase FtsK [Ammoniphilus sp. CFH 90114]
MASSKNKKSKKQNSPRFSLKSTLVFELYGLVLLAVFLITLSKYGWVGETFSWIVRFLTGTWDFIIPLIGIFCAAHIMVRRQWPILYTPRWVGLFIIFFSVLLFDHILFFDQLSAQGKFTDQSIVKISWDAILQEKAQLESGMVSTTDIGGGMIGAVGLAINYYLFARTGTMIIAFFSFLIGLMLLFQISYVALFTRGRDLVSVAGKSVANKGKEAVHLMLERAEKEDSKNEVTKGKPEPKGDFSSVDFDFRKPAMEPQQGSFDPPVIHDFIETAYKQEELDLGLEPLSSKEPSSRTGGTKEKPAEVELDLKDMEFIQMEESNGVIVEEPAPHYEIPSLSLLARPKLAKQQGKEYRDMQSNARKLEQTLESFGVNARVMQIHRGPTVTRYEVQPAVGVKVSKIVNLADDIALALAAKDIRIEAPIPGKSAIGIEVPNSEVAVVSLREVLESGTYQDSEGKLNVGLGRDISGEPIIANLAKMPHLLVAGATGSGKSVCINGIITSVLFKAKPHEVKLMMIDPKMVELNMYNGIPHLLAPVVTDARRASMALKKVVVEMEKRYELFAKSGTRNIDLYNQAVVQSGTGKPLPFIVVIVDELADLMMVAAGDVEDAICRLAQMARAAGIHLIIATQRPSVDVITGVIKANIPSRIAFGVSSMTDSRTILDMGGAEKLLGRGDMLYLPMGASKPTRVQGAFVSDEEVEAVVEYVKNQQSAKYHAEMIPAEPEQVTEAVPEDDLYDEAVKLVIEAQTASASLLQRRFRIGYTRAARLVDMMEANKIVGPFEGSKPREVLVKKNESNIS